MLTPQSSFDLAGVRFHHRACLVDFAGNERDPAHWVDLFASEEGMRVLRLGGNWRHYGAAPPTILPEADHSFLPFLAACEVGDEIAVARTCFPFAR